MAKTEAALQRCSENMQQTYRRVLMLRCDINKVAKCAFIFMGVLLQIFMGVLLLHVFRTPFPKNTSERLLLQTFAKTRQYENLLQKCVWLIYNQMRNFITTNAGQNWGEMMKLIKASWRRWSNSFYAEFCQIFCMWKV